MKPQFPGIEMMWLTQMVFTRRKEIFIKSKEMQCSHIVAILGPMHHVAWVLEPLCDITITN